MKSVRNVFISNQERKNLVSVGTPGHPVKSFTKADFLPYDAVAAKFEISEELAQSIMQMLFKKKAIFVLNGHRANVIVNMNQGTDMFLHPMATEIFQKYLEKQK